MHRDEELGSPEHLLGGATSRHPGASKLVHHPAELALRQQEPPEEIRDASATRCRSLGLVRDVMWPIGIFELPSRAPSLGLTERHVRVMAQAHQQWLPLVQLAADLDAGWNWFLDGVLVFMGRADTPVDDAIAYCGRQ